jgi:hypothetical protein
MYPQAATCYEEVLLHQPASIATHVQVSAMQPPCMRAPCCRIPALCNMVQEGQAAATPAREHPALACMLSASWHSQSCLYKVLGHLVGCAVRGCAIHNGWRSEFSCSARVLLRSHRPEQRGECARAVRPLRDRGAARRAERGLRRRRQRRQGAQDSCLCFRVGLLACGLCNPCAYVVRAKQGGAGMYCRARRLATGQQMIWRCWRARRCSSGMPGTQRTSCRW